MKYFRNQAKLVKRLFLLIKGSIKGNIIHAYWFDNIINFGDQLTPMLLKHYGFTPIKEPRISSEVLALGSILDEIHENYSGYIVGSGLMYDSRKFYKNAKILAVRGKLTRDRIGAPENTILGDPGLLVPKLLKRRQRKMYMLGLVPHYSEKSDKRINKIYHHYPEDVLIIDVQDKPEKVISSIDKCAYILSSSLHGIITADALGIPCAWINLSDSVEGGGFKFYDYVSAFDGEITPKKIKGDERLSELVKLTNEPSPKISIIQNDLDSVFQTLHKEIIEKNKTRHN